MGTGGCGFVLLLRPSSANSSIKDFLSEPGLVRSWNRERPLSFPPLFHFHPSLLHLHLLSPPGRETEETSCLLECEIDDLERLRAVRSWTREPAESQLVPNGTIFYARCVTTCIVVKFMRTRNYPILSRFWVNNFRFFNFRLDLDLEF